MITQIYAIQSPEEAVACLDAGAHYLGISCDTVGMDRAERIKRCQQIFATMGDRGVKVALTVADEPEPILEIIELTKPDVIHVCGDNYYATPEFCKTVHERFPGVRVEQAIGVTGPEAVAQAELYGAFCDILILDSVSTTVPGVGAAGFSHDWNISAEIVRRVKCDVILAGGLGPDNVADAIEKVRPWGVDSLTKTNLPKENGISGGKDFAKVKAFCENAMAKAKELGL